MQTIQIIFVLIGGILSVVMANKWKDIDTKGKVKMVVAILSCIVIAFNSFVINWDQNLDDKINSKHGKINTKGATTPLVVLGYKDNGIVIDLSNNPILNNGHGNNSDDMIGVVVKDGKLLVDVVIRNSEGEIIARIDDTTWSIFSDDYEYNDDDTAFELVTKGERDVFFQIFYKNGKAYISGYILGSKGIGTIIYSNKREVNSTQLFVNSSEVLGNKIPQPKDIKIPRLFKYPRELFYSKRL